MSVWIEAPESIDGFERERCETLAQRLMTAAGEDGSELSVALVDDEAIRQLNRDYRETDTATDVLSFSMREGEAIGQDCLLGDIVISYETAARQAAELGRHVEEELDELLFHGFLHLMGHDHYTNEDRKAWLAAEDALRRRLNELSAPYAPRGLAAYENETNTSEGEGPGANAARDEEK